MLAFTQPCISYALCPETGERRMNVSVTDRFKPQDAAELYGLEGWGNGYLAIGEDGHDGILFERRSAAAPPRG